MLGIHDPWVLTAYLGAIGLAVAGVVYGLVRRDVAPDELTQEDRLWALEEKRVEDEL